MKFQSRGGFYLGGEAFSPTACPSRIDEIYSLSNNTGMKYEEWLPKFYQKYALTTAIL